MAKLDTITLSVLQAALQQVCDEMDLTFSRAAFSPVIIFVASRPTRLCGPRVARRHRRGRRAR